MQNIDLYYESLKQVYDQAEKWSEHKLLLREKILKILIGIFGFLCALSLIPILPAILVYYGGQKWLCMWGIDPGTATFGIFIRVWIVAFIGTGIILSLMAWIKSKVKSPIVRQEEQKQKLSPDQATFVAIYESYKELKIYFISHIERHVDNSLKALRKVVHRSLWRLSPSHIEQRIILEREFALSSIEREFLMHREIESREFLPFKLIPNFAMQISIAQSFLNTFEKYNWFQLDTATKSILQAIISFPAKVYYRLLEKEDLATVLRILENLSKFLYAFLPEHKTYMEPETLQKLQDEGQSALKSFVQQVNDLVPYQPVIEKEELAKTKITTPGLRIRLKKLYSENIFFRFTIWFLIIFMLTSGIIYLISQRVPNIDVNIMVSLVIGTSVTGAAALAAFAPKLLMREKEEREEREKEKGDSE